MKLYSNEGYSLRHTIWQNIAEAMITAAFVFPFASMVLICLPLFFPGIDSFAYCSALACILPVFFFAFLHGYAGDKADAAFRDYLDNDPDNRKRTPFRY